MTRSRSKINTIYGEVDGEYYISSKWLFTANLSMHQHFVESRDKNIIIQSGDKGIVGYRQARVELSGAVSAKCKKGYEKYMVFLNKINNIKKPNPFYLNQQQIHIYTHTHTHT